MPRSMEAYGVYVDGVKAACPLLKCRNVNVGGVGGMNEHLRAFFAFGRNHVQHISVSLILVGFG
jgi:hypothetical protein